MIKIWSDRAIPDKYVPLLDGVAEETGARAETPNESTASLPGADGAVVSARIQYNGELFDQVPTLKVISRTGIGYDNINIPDATARNIAVCHTPDGPTISTAELTIGLLLSITRQIKKCEADMIEGRKMEYMYTYKGWELAGKTLGLVGLGRIGGHVSKIARGIGMEIIVYDPFISPDRAVELGVKLVPTLEDVLKSADVVSLHLPLSDDTRYTINTDNIGLMKKGAYLLNCARGGLLEEKALLGALDSGHLAGAGIDVYEKEPAPPDHPYLNRLDIVATPHVAGVTDVSRDSLWTTAIKQVIQVCQGEKPAHLLNPEIWKD